MPDDSVVSGLDVKFGTLDFGIEPSGFDLALDVTSTASTMAPSSSAPLPSSDSQKPTQQQQQQQQQQAAQPSLPPHYVASGVELTKYVGAAVTNGSANTAAGVQPIGRVRVEPGHRPNYGESVR